MRKVAPDAYLAGGFEEITLYQAYDIYNLSRHTSYSLRQAMSPVNESILESVKKVKKSKIWRLNETTDNYAEAVSRLFPEGSVGYKFKGWKKDKPEFLIDHLTGELRFWELMQNMPVSLFVRCTGNRSEKLIDVYGYDIAYGEFQERNASLDNVIWVANVTFDGVLADDSAYPGEEFKDHTLCAVGTNVDVLKYTEPSLIATYGMFTKSNGTSLSTPIAAGVLAMIKGAFLSFTPFDLKTCLLESANTYHVVNGIHVALDPLKYGKGILNPKHALLYAQTLHDLRRTDASLLADDVRVKAAYRTALL